MLRQNVRNELTRNKNAHQLEHVSVVLVRGFALEELNDFLNDEWRNVGKNGCDHAEGEGDQILTSVSLQD